MQYGNTQNLHKLIYYLLNFQFYKIENDFASALS